MSTQTHLDALKTKHRSLEAKLSEALAHTSSSDQEIAGIKHQKLALKDQITALEAKLRPVAFA